MRGIVLRILIVALLCAAALAVAQVRPRTRVLSDREPDGVLGAAGTGAAGVGVKVSAYVAEDGAWPIVTVRSVQGFDHALAVDIEGALAAFKIGDVVASKQRGRLVPEVAASAGDSLLIQVRSFTNADTTAGEMVLFAAKKVAVRRGGGAGITVSPVLAGWGETPYVDLAVDLGYAVTGDIDAKCDSLEMFSVGLAKSELDTLNARHKYSQRLYLPDNVRAFKGDSLHVYVELDAGTFISRFRLGDDLPGTMKHVLAYTVVADSTEVALRKSAVFRRYNDRASHANTTVLRFGPGGDITTVAAFNANRAQPDAYGAYSHTINLKNTSAADYTTPRTNQRYIMMYFPWEDIIPANSTVVDARVNVQATANFTEYGATDSLVAVMMSRAADSEWYVLNKDGRGGGIGTTMRPGQAYASWNYQLQGYHGDYLVNPANSATMQGLGYPEHAAHAWSPSLNDRDWTDWCDTGEWPIAQMTKERLQGSYTAPSTGHWYGWSVGRLAQAAINGTNNNGMVLYWRDTTPTDQARGHYAIWHIVTSGTRHATAYFTTSFIDGLPYDDPFDGYSLKYVLVTDDGRPRSQMNWGAAVDSMRAAGKDVTFTAALNNPRDAEWSSDPDSLAVITGLNPAIEIADHSRRHFGLTYGTDWAGAADTTRFDHYYRNGGSPDFAGFDCFHPGVTPSSPDYDSWIAAGGRTAMDSLWVEIDPCWHDDFGAWPRPTGHALALHSYTQPALFALNRMGYRAVRCGGANFNQTMTANGSYYHWYATNNHAQGGAAPGDTLQMWRMHNLLDPINMLGMPISCPTVSFVGPRGGARLSEAQVRANTRLHWFRLRHRNQFILLHYTHDDGNSGSYSDDHMILAQELVWIWDELLKLGAHVTTLSDASDWRWSLSIPWHTPAAWGQIDHYKATRDEEMWGRLTWLDAVKLGGRVPWLWPGGALY